MRFSVITANETRDRLRRHVQSRGQRDADHQPGQRRGAGDPAVPSILATDQRAPLLRRPARVRLLGREVVGSGMRRRFAMAWGAHLSRQTVPAFIQLRASARPTFDLARVSLGGRASGECGGSWRKCGRQLGDTGHACGRAWGHDLQNVPGPIRARDRDGGRSPGSRGDVRRGRPARCRPCDRSVR